jgi:hypothetical protein
MTDLQTIFQIIQQAFGEAFHQETDYFLITNINEENKSQKYYYCKIYRHTLVLIIKSSVKKSKYELNTEKEVLIVNGQEVGENYLDKFKEIIQKVITDFKNDKSQLVEKRKAGVKPASNNVVQQDNAQKIKSKEDFDLKKQNFVQSRIQKLY